MASFRCETVLVLITFVSIIWSMKVMKNLMNMEADMISPPAFLSRPSARRWQKRIVTIPATSGTIKTDRGAKRSTGLNETGTVSKSKHTNPVDPKIDEATKWKEIKSNKRVNILEEKGDYIEARPMETTDTKLKDGENFPRISYKTDGSAKKPVQLRLGPIFYNLFVPTPYKVPESEEKRREQQTANVTNIVWEQMLQINKTAPGSMVRYTLISDDDALADGMRLKLQEYCGSRCSERARVTRGDEATTMEAVREYCLLESRDPAEIVTYLHDKGSLHFTPHNEKSRRFSTKAALECRNSMMEHPEQCNICNGRFYVFPQYIGTANMWSATCGYIKRLYSPIDYPARMRQLYDEFLLNQTHAERYACLRPVDLAENHLGVGRYALERWVWSHPHVRPCDVLPYGINRAPSTLEGQDTWSPVLKASPTSGHRPKFFSAEPQQNSFARLDGRLLEWSFVYPGKKVPSDSWMWNFYKDLVHGNDAWMKKCGGREQSQK